MRMTSKLSFVSRFTQVIARGMAASAQAVVNFATEHVVPTAKDTAHEYFAGSPDSTGRLERSIHSAPIQYDGASDYDEAFYRDLDNVEIDDIIDDQIMNDTGHFVLVAGSWLPYACVVEAGRKMAYMTPAVETLAGSRAEEIVRAAFYEQGLGTV